MVPCAMSFHRRWKHLSDSMETKLWCLYNVGDVYISASWQMNTARLYMVLAVDSLNVLLSVLLLVICTMDRADVVLSAALCHLLFLCCVFCTLTLRYGDTKLMLLFLSSVHHWPHSWYFMCSWMSHLGLLSCMPRVTDIGLGQHTTVKSRSSWQLTICRNDWDFRRIHC